MYSVLDKKQCCLRLREDIAKEVGFVERHLSHYTGNQWKEFFRMLPSTAESLLREIAPFMAEPENHKKEWSMFPKICGGSIHMTKYAVNCNTLMPNVTSRQLVWLKKFVESVR